MLLQENVTWGSLQCKTVYFFKGHNEGKTLPSINLQTVFISGETTGCLLAVALLVCCADVLYSYGDEN